MTTIIAGHFENVDQLQDAVGQLGRQGFAPSDFATYFLNPPGQRGLYWLGGDAPSDQGTTGAGKGAAVGGAVGGTAGLAVGSIGGPIGALAGAGVGAYVGSLIGALSRMHEPEPDKATVEHPAEPPGGPMIAINVDRPGAEAAAIGILGRCGAVQINRANGTWQAGEWTDYDPRQPIDVLLQRKPGT